MNNTDTLAAIEGGKTDSQLPADASKITPPHYHGDEAMKFIERFELGFALGTAVKYIARAGKKPGESELEDLQKARWYLDRRLLQLRTQK